MKEQDGAGDGDQGLELAAALDDPPIAFTEKGVGAGGRGDGLAECSIDVGVAHAGPPGAVLRAGLDGPRAQPGPRHQVLGGWKPGHVQPDFGDDLLGDIPADAGDLIQPANRGQLPGSTASMVRRAAYDNTGP
jgi:hypothetical protein